MTFRFPSLRPGFARLRPALLLPLGLLPLACGKPHGTPSSSPAAPRPAVNVEVAPVERDGTLLGRQIPGLVAARDAAALTVRRPSAVVALPHPEGSSVKAGDLVARLDDSAQRAALAAARAEEEAALTDERRVAAMVAEGIAPKRDADTARSRLEAARAAVEAARSELGYAELRAPYAGRVARIPVRVGDVVSPGQSVVEIEGAGGLEVRASAEGEQLAGLRPGSRVPVRVDGVADAVTGTIRSISPSGDPQTHRFDLRVDLPAATGLRTGQFARIDLPLPGGAPRLFVPSRATFERGGLVGVFVVVDGVARLRWVAAGDRAGDRIEVRAGLAAGESVALDPAPLADGTPVREVAK